MSSEEQSRTPPFTKSFNLENPTLIDLEFLDKEEKMNLLSDLQRRHDFGSKSLWTDDHQNLLLRLQEELSINKTNVYVPEKDKPLSERR